MKSFVMKSIYAGLGMLGSGKQTVEQVGRKWAKKVNMSEKDGEKIAKHLKQKSEKAIHAVQKSMEAEVKKVVHAFHAATGHGASASAKHRKASPPKAKRRSPAKHAAPAATHH